MADITDFFGAATSILTAYAGRPPQVNVIQGKTPGAGVVGGNGGPQLMAEGPSGGPGQIYDCATGPPPPPDCGPSPVYKKVCGSYRWVYPKRRRRKQLLTKSDLSGLSSLIGLLGNGKGLQSWIATHPS